MKVLIVSLTGLIVIIALVYGALIYVKGEKEKVLAEMTDSDSTVVKSKPLSETDSLKKVVEMKEQELTKKETKFDSLKNESKKQVQIAKKETKKEIAGDNDNSKTEKARSMAKTFEKMSIKQIAPILNNLDDKTVMMIYVNTGNRFKKNILLAVNEKRAALITKQFINN